MPEEVLFESESRRSRAEIAAYLRTVADSLESDNAITLQKGEQSVTMDPPARPTFEVKAEREGRTTDRASSASSSNWSGTRRVTVTMTVATAGRATGS